MGCLYIFSREAPPPMHNRVKINPVNHLAPLLISDIIILLYKETDKKYLTKLIKCNKLTKKQAIIRMNCDNNANDVFPEIDEDGSGTMDFEEFCDLMMTTADE